MHLDGFVELRERGQQRAVQDMGTVSADEYWEGVKGDRLMSCELRKQSDVGFVESMGDNWKDMGDGTISLALDTSN